MLSEYRVNKKSPFMTSAVPVSAGYPVGPPIRSRWWLVGPWVPRSSFLNSLPCLRSQSPDVRPTRKGDVFMKKTLLYLFAATVALAGCSSQQAPPTSVQNTYTAICKKLPNRKSHHCSISGISHFQVRSQLSLSNSASTRSSFLPPIRGFTKWGVLRSVAVLSNLYWKMRLSEWGRFAMRC